MYESYLILIRTIVKIFLNNLKNLTTDYLSDDIKELFLIFYV